MGSGSVDVSSETSSQNANLCTTYFFRYRHINSEIMIRKRTTHRELYTTDGALSRKKNFFREYFSEKGNFSENYLAVIVPLTSGKYQPLAQSNHCQSLDPAAPMQSAMGNPTPCPSSHRRQVPEQVHQRKIRLVKQRFHLGVVCLVLSVRFNGLFNADKTVDRFKVGEQADTHAPYDGCAH